MKNQIRIQKELIEKAKAFKASGGSPFKINDKGEKVYSEGFGKYIKNKIKPSGEYLDEMFKSYKIDYQYSPDKAIELMNIQFPNQNWEEILEMYIKGKTGGTVYNVKFLSNYYKTIEVEKEQKNFYHQIKKTIILS